MIEALDLKRTAYRLCLLSLFSFHLFLAPFLVVHVRDSVISERDKVVCVSLLFAASLFTNALLPCFLHSFPFLSSPLLVSDLKEYASKTESCGSVESKSRKKKNEGKEGGRNSLDLIISVSTLFVLQAR